MKTVLVGSIFVAAISVTVLGCVIGQLVFNNAPLGGSIAAGLAIATAVKVKEQWR